MNDDLIARLIAGPGSRELDAEIALIVCPFLADMPRTEIGGWQHPEFGRIAPPSEYTTSIDAALTFAVGLVGASVAARIPLAAIHEMAGLYFGQEYIEALPRYIVVECLKAMAE